MENVSNKMNELIKITTNDEGDNLVSARELHEFLEVGRDFTTWIKAKIDKYGFKENIDFTIIDGFHQNGGKGGRPEKNYVITLDMAKELSMVENNDKGRQARQYFIRCERKMKEQYEFIERKSEFGEKIDAIVKLVENIPDKDRSDMMLKLLDRFYPIGNSCTSATTPKENNDKELVIEILKDSYDEAYLGTSGNYVILDKGTVYKNSSKKGIGKIKFNKMLVNNKLVKGNGCGYATNSYRLNGNTIRALFVNSDIFYL